MTPAINAAKKAKISFEVLEYTHDSNTDSYGLEAVEKLGVSASDVYKTLVVQTEQLKLVVCIIPVSSKLSMKHAAKALGAKKAKMADKSLVERTTGYVLGGVSPLGQKKRLDTLIDASAEPLSTMYVSAGRRGLEIALSPKELAQLTKARFTALCQ